MENKPEISTEAYRPVPWRGWVLARRLSQIFFFLLFVLLFLKTTYTGQEVLGWPVDLFFRFDPLILAAHLLDHGQLVWRLFLSLILVGLTLILGRFFCGWICPMGTTLDGCRRLLFRPRPDRGYALRLRQVKYYLLFFLLAAALFKVNLVGLFDPLSLLYRTLGIVVYPELSYGLEESFATAYKVGKPLTYVSEPMYQYLKDTILPFRKQVFLLPFFTVCCFALIVALERVDRRFWCRALCPLGALYGLAARFSWLRRRPFKLCKDCGDCQEVCKMGSIHAEVVPQHQMAECQLCMSCQEACQKDRVSFKFGGRVARPALDLGRRQVVTAMAAGVVAVPLIRLGSVAQRPDEYSAPAAGSGVRGGISFHLHSLRPVLQSLPHRGAAAGLVGSGVGRSLHFPPGPPPGILRIRLQSLLPGLPHRGHPHHAPGREAGPPDGNCFHQSVPVHSLHRRQGLFGVRRTLSHVAQGHHLLRGGGEGPRRQEGAGETASGQP